MSHQLKGLKPLLLWNNFYHLTQIPRPSKKEQQVVDFVVNFAIKHQLDYTVDEVGNVIIRKPATTGFENRQGVILQAHLDMVPQKNNDVEHNFETDPIAAYVDGDWVTAQGTTLGADNGIGVAAMLSVLQDNNLNHGPIEALFTIDEETGMTGAFELKPGLLNGQILMNLDSEDEGELYIGCAGGINTLVNFYYKTEEPPAGYTAFKVTVKGLKGGHSGMDIVLQRGNANKVLNTILLKGKKNLALRLASINGGSLRNAIPREAEAMVAVPNSGAETFQTYAGDVVDSFRKKHADDQEIQVIIEPVQMPKEFIEKDVFFRFIEAIDKMPNGVVNMDTTMPNVVETSSNLAVIKSDGKKIEVLSLQRSSVDASKRKLTTTLQKLFEEYGAEIEFSGEYPGWKPNYNSPILATMSQLYQKKYQKKPDVKVIHAGLECGILGSIYTNWDMISFGPTIRYPHSPDEKVHIESVQKFWDFLIETLENIPEKV